MRTILVVEDEPQIATLVRDYLEHAGFAVLLAGDGGGALAVARTRRPDAIVLDLGLPVVDGLDVVRALRRDSAVPIVVLTARGDEADRVAGLELGADDYVVKPFGLRELSARMRAVSRRVGGSGAARDITTIPGPNGILSIEHRTGTILLDGIPIELTRREHDLLVFLADDAGRLYERNEILERVWSPHWYGPTKTLDVHVAGLRRKLGDPAWIETVRSVGYRLVPVSGTPCADA